MTNLILLGFMGTGKSTLGEALSKRLSWPFVDLDLEIEKKLKMDIAGIFARYGEVFFRQVESELLNVILQKDRQVLATGGGAVLNHENRALMQKRGIPILLKASLDLILLRTALSDRPLLQVENPRERVQELLHAREESYNFAEFSIDTGELSLNEAVEEIIQRVGDILGRAIC